MRDRGSAIIIEDNKIALIKRKRDGIEYYVFPGGGIEKDETPEEATKREVLEELGVTVRVNELWTTVQYNGIQYFFSCDVIDGEFGTGIGEEYGTENCGTYEPVWIEIDVLKQLDVRPEKLVRILQDSKIAKKP